MNKKIRGMIDSVFADMKMSAENLALRDELMANAEARYEDSIAEGRSEEEAFAEVAASLEDVRATLIEMNEQADAAKHAEAPSDDKAAAESGTADFADAFARAFDMIGDFGKQILPQMSKFAQQADDATGKVFSEFGKAVGKGAVEVGRVAGEAIDMISKTIQEASKRELSEEELLTRAREIRIQAEIRQEADDQEGARELRRKAYELEVQAEKLRKAREAAEAEKVAKRKTVEVEAEDAEFEQVTPEDAPADVPNGTASEEPVDVPDADVINNPDGVLDPDELESVVDQILDDVNEEVDNEGIHLEDAPENVTVTNRFDPAVVRSVAVNLDADDVTVTQSETSMIEVEWNAEGNAQQPNVSVSDGVLTVNRKNPDIFQTFFSVFRKEGGKLVIRVPEVIALAYRIKTTSGDITVDGVAAKELSVDSISGQVRIEPDVNTIAEKVHVNTVSGQIDAEVHADSVDVTTVSGGQTVDGITQKVEMNSVSGTIRCQCFADEYDAESVSGNITIACKGIPGGKIKMSTVSGSATLVLPSDIKGFRAETSGIGGIASNDFGVDRYGTCALPIRFDSMSGKLTISRSEG